MARDTNGITPELRRQAIDRLFAERGSCVIRNGSDMRVFYERGVKDLYRLLKEEPGLLRGAFVADKVVGKAAAALLALGGVEEVFADVISRPALDLLEKNAVGRRLQALRAAYRQPVRIPAGVRWKSVATGLQTPEECLAQVTDFIETMKREG